MDTGDSTLYEGSVGMASRSLTPIDDFEIIDNEPEQNSLTLDIHPLPSQDAVLVSINPPRQPRSNVKHVPCDIVLVIDVSGSMSWSAPLPDVQDKDSKESSGLSILDLTKHAARTILDTLNEGDRLGIVTFSVDARIEQRLTHMTPTAKAETIQRIESLVDRSATNLWAGIKAGLNMFRTANFIGNVQGLFVLTDGMPNHMCPPQGYMTKLTPMLEDMALHTPCVPTIHTFGFGYDILSSLLQGIAEVGHGNYAFIPDAGMIGTVFVHAIANLYTTFATAVQAEVTTSDNQCVLECEMGLPTTLTKSNGLSIKLGNIQYGQSRDVIIACRKVRPGTTIAVKVTYKLPNGSPQRLSCTSALAERRGTLSAETAAYHLHRAQLCHLLSTLCPPMDRTSTKKPALPSSAHANAVALSKLIESSLGTHSHDQNIRSLYDDLLGDVPTNLETGDIILTGQIYQALLESKTHPYYSRWGAHYLPSLLHAHRRQICNSFKDPGPLRYGTTSPLFIHCRDELDAAFDNLPAPKPSIATYTKRDANGRSVTHYTVPLSSLSRYNRYDNPCFLGSCLVTIITSEDTKVKIAVQDLRPGSNIFNPITQESRPVIAVIRTQTQPGSPQKIYRIPSNTPDNLTTNKFPASTLWITAYHPVLHNKTWIHPHSIANQSRPLAQDEAVYSILLSPSPNPDSHAVEIESIPCVTLGHGLINNQSTTNLKKDIRAHPFFGSHTKVSASLSLLPLNSKRQHVCSGLSRDRETGLADGFLCPLQYPLHDRVPESTRGESAGHNRLIRTAQCV